MGLIDPRHQIGGGLFAKIGRDITDADLIRPLRRGRGRHRWFRGRHIRGAKMREHCCREAGSALIAAPGEGPHHLLAGRHARGQARPGVHETVPQVGSLHLHVEQFAFQRAGKPAPALRRPVGSVLASSGIAALDRPEQKAAIVEGGGEVELRARRLMKAGQRLVRSSQRPHRRRAGSTTSASLRRLRDRCAHNRPALPPDGRERPAPRRDRSDGRC